MNKLSKGLKYLILLVIALVVMYFGSTIYILITYVPYKMETGISFQDYYNAIVAINYYYSTDIVEGMEITWHEYATQLFVDTALFENTKLVFCVIQLVSYCPLVVILIYFLKDEIVKDFKAFKKDIGRNLIIMVICWVGMLLLSNFVALIYEKLGIQGESANESIINLILDSKGMIIMAIAVVIFAPICEELIFRKLLIDTCEFKMKPVFAIIISALVFSFIHVSDLENLKFIFQYVALALPMCCAYHFSKNNIFTSLTLHFVNNLLSIISIFLTVSLL